MQTTQDRSTEAIKATEVKKESNPKFKISKKHLLIGVGTVAVVTGIGLFIPNGDKAGNQQASVAAANAAENTNTVSSNSSTDGYKITSSAPQPQSNTGATTTANSSTPGNSAVALQPASASPSMNAQLSSIATQVGAIQSALANNPDNAKAIKAQLNSVVFQLKDVISESDSDISADIQSSAQTLATQLNGMKGQLTNIQQLSQPGGYIDPSNLPFTVQFIDSVSGQSVVTVSYKNLLTPLSVGESLAGWTLISADYASQYAIFQNAKDQLVKAGNTAANQGA